MKNPMIIATQLVVDTLDTYAVSSALNGITGFGTVLRPNAAYEILLKNGLIKRTGRPVDKDILEACLSAEFAKRTKDKTST